MATMVLVWNATGSMRRHVETNVAWVVRNAMVVPTMATRATSHKADSARAVRVRMGWAAAAMADRWQRAWPHAHEGHHPRKDSLGSR